MKRTKVILCRSGDYDPDVKLVRQLADEFPEVTFVDLRKDEFLARQEELLDAEVFVGWPTREQLEALPNLKWVQLQSAGANGYTNNPYLREDVALTNASGVFNVPGAEHALALMLAFARQLHVHFDQQQNKRWKRNPLCLEIQSSTVGVIGLGGIGGETAKRAKALGARVVAVKRNPDAPPPYVDRLYPIEEVEELLAVSDFVVMALPLTEETRGFLHADRIAKIKRGAVLINVGRGPTVDERALIQALQEGALFGAGLDVTEVEPLPEESPLWGMPNVIITSHSVGVSPRKEERRMELLSANLRRFLAGEPLHNLVDRNAGY
ncbi:D-2-hydroxyacid dehydrogenase [Xylanibacillus composti]|uniref:3-phosphoglycerate dehydrogenase n=1 Tax=Xylanibacillus composti TaxID=1572762 RepID=A0A8J4M2Q5_9BACL|nr:D-2-hydroxyacid dehydrogenase [Xylanibacillus composti]MDT9726481.1 D-2-hydroxyacid dehydrogenase [Xylanibacillus composti]GIQ69949.1 3-phosphoglycerate dehydrogenase [Xylanibacillus composti]